MPSLGIFLPPSRKDVAQPALVIAMYYYYKDSLESMGSVCIYDYNFLLGIFACSMLLRSGRPNGVLYYTTACSCLQSP